MKISTSFLACKDIVKAVRELSLTDADYIHMDYVDFGYIEGREISFRKMKKVSKVTTKRFDVHLMTDDLKKSIYNFSSFNCEYITFHIEATDDPIKYINMIHSYNIKCGLALNPETEIGEIEPYLGEVDLILVMGVEPGFGGKEFVPEVEDKIKELRKRITFHNLNTLISVDGGVNEEIYNKIKDYVDIVVVGSFVTNSDNYQEQINKLK